jgi:hypothetical protein
MCSIVFRGWSYGDVDHDDKFLECIDFMGIKAHCASLGGGVGQEYPQKGVHPKFLKCVFPSEPDDVLDQIEHIATGVAQGLVTAAPFVALGAQAIACVDGVLFACGTLALEVGEHLDAVPDDVKVAYDLVNATLQCSDGDIISCAKLGAAGVKAAGVKIPGENVGLVARLSQNCANEDFGACMQLGEMAAGAAGVPVDAINQVAKNAQDCYSGNVDACTALGRQAAKAGDFPVGGVTHGAENLRRCAENIDTDLLHCQQLGLALAATTR